jgi:hypothetical protein
MKHRDPLPCALCQRFDTSRSYCEGYERMRRHDDTNEACPLWNRARDEAARRKWAERQEKSK